MVGVSAEHSSPGPCPPSDAGNFCSNPDTTKFQNYVFTISKSDAIIGGNPARQQLCVVDSLWANKPENTGKPDYMPCYLVMGTFGPAVDYITIKKIREGVMGATHTPSLVSQYMTQFGYTTADPIWVPVPPAGTDPGTCASTGTGGASGSGGSSDTGGAGSGGAKGTGGAGSGGSSGAGGVGSGGAKSTGGTGSGGSSASSSASSGGAKGTGGVGTGGAVGSGGSTSSSEGGGGGSSGALASITPASGGSSGSGGTSGGTVANGKSGCSCRVGGGRNAVTGPSAALVVGTLVAGQLRRLFRRRETLAQPTQPKAEANPSLVARVDAKVE